MGITKRVPGAPGGGSTSRLHHLFQLEGDESGGYLLLEGDAQSGADRLKLEGDAAAIGSTTTQQISGTPSAGMTQRISGTPSGGGTTRVATRFSFLQLAGDQQDNGGRLLLAGDQQSGTDVLRVVGDQETTIEPNVTKRVTQ